MTEEREIGHGSSNRQASPHPIAGGQHHRRSAPSERRREKPSPLPSQADPSIHARAREYEHGSSRRGREEDCGVAAAQPWGPVGLSSHRSHHRQSRVQQPFAEAADLVSSFPASVSSHRVIHRSINDRSNYPNRVDADVASVPLPRPFPLHLSPLSIILYPSSSFLDNSSSFDLVTVIESELS